MVTEDRAQLVLVGASAIGIVLIAMTTVLNSAVFTENVARGSADEVAGDVQEFDRGAIRDVRSVALRVNHDYEYRTAPGHSGEANLTTDVKANVSSYSDLLAESYADTGSVYVNVSPAGETMGSRIVQNEDNDFQDDPDAGAPLADWTPVTGPFRIGWFVMNVDVQNVSKTNPVEFELTAGSDVLSITLRQTSDGDLDVRSDINGGNVSDVTCQPTNGRVLLDLADGTSYTGDCTFNSTEHLTPPYNQLEIFDGDRGHGKYDLVVNRSDPSSIDAQPCVSGREPCRSVAVWSVNFETHYRTQSIGYTRNHTVEVYGG
jgi:hypothetical protein